MKARVVALVLLGFLVLAPHGILLGSLDAQQSRKVYRIGWLARGSPSTFEHLVRALREGLHELGYREGDNLLLDIRSAEGHYNQLPALAAALVRDQVDVIVSPVTPTTRAAKHATSSVPIVMVGVADPVASGLVAGLARPGGNITGLALAWGEGIKGKWVEFIKEAVPTASRIGVLVNTANPDHPTWVKEMDLVAARLAVKLHPFGGQDGGNVTGLSRLTPELLGKNLEILTEAVPGTLRVGVLSNPSNPLHVTMVGRIKDAATSRGLQLNIVQAGTSTELERAFSAMVTERVNVVLVPADGLFFVNRDRVAALALKSRLPSMFQNTEHTQAGGLLSYAPNSADNYRRAASYVDRILKGARPADLPIQQPEKFELVINLKTAKALGLTIPPSLLLRADQVIE